MNNENFTPIEENKKNNIEALPNLKIEEQTEETIKELPSWSIEPPIEINRGQK